MKNALLLICLLSWAAPAQPHPSATPAAESKEAVVRARIESEESDEAAPHAKDENRPAVFGIMIANRQRQMLGTPIHAIQRASVMPWIFSLILLPVYLHIARRRGFRIRGKAR